MISRAYVEGIVDETHVKVRIPRVNKVDGAVGATPYAELAVGVMCSPPGYAPRLKRGDTVLVAYEDDDEGSPVVLGLLFNPKSTTTADINIDSATFNVNTELPEETSIGDVTKENIKNLIGLKNNAQKQLDDLNLKSDNNLTLINETTKSLEEFENIYNTYINKLENTLNNINTSISTLSEGVTKIRNGYYGTQKPTSAGEEGQIYIWIQ